MATLIRLAKTMFGFCVLFLYDPGLAAQDTFSIIEKANSIAPARKFHGPGSRISPVPLSASRRTQAPLPVTNIPAYPYLPPARIENLQNGNCKDSSFFKIFEAQNRAYTFLTSAKTKDGGIVLGGYGRNKLTGPPVTWYSVVTKIDSLGQHIWSKELRSDVIQGRGLYIEAISVLSDGSILVSGEYHNPLSTSPPTPTLDFFMAKLTATGDLVWLKTFHSSLGNGCTSSNIRYVSVAEGVNGELYLGGTVPNCPEPRYLVVMKLNNAGNIIWQYNFQGHFTKSYCIGIFYNGSYVTVINRGESNTPNGVSVDLVRLNSTTGAYTSHKSWEPDLPYPGNWRSGFLNWTPAAVKLNNGNYCVYGNTFGNFFNPLGADLPQFSVIEFNGNDDFVKGYTINSTLVTNAYQSQIRVDRFGKVFYSMSVNLTYPDEIKYIGMADNGTILHQRKKPINGFEHFFDNAELFDDGSAAYINNVATVNQDNFYLYYSLLHVTDTGSQCLGTLENFSHTVPISYKPNLFAWTAANPNPIITTNNQNNSVSPIQYTDGPPCYQTTFCDTLEIRGDTTLCDLQQDLSFTAFKNPECGAKVNWFIDPSVIQTFQLVNDTTVLLRFSKEWQGWLYATMVTSCGEFKDSVLLTIAVSPGPVNIGPDTAICAANTITLNARKGYTTYRWSNGATDSLIVVSAPGTYYVDVTDACGNSFSDTVLVSPAPPILISLGPDRSSCNSDTLHLHAPSGFMNYAWSPNYNINATNTQQVVVKPAVDTAYIVKAEKTPGCFGYDTIRINVNHSIPINFGPDKDLCAGDSLILDAGAGFMQYQWNNGNITQKIAVSSAGSYSVIATDAEGCRSLDTLIVSNVYPLPTVSLNQDSTLCAGSSKTLDAGNGFMKYNWNTGSTSSSIVVRDLGLYAVTVTDDHGCKAADSTKITWVWPQPSAFLGPDTAMCPYDNLQLRSMSNFEQYKWSTGSVSSSINIKQPGNYWLQVKDSIGCFGKDSIIVAKKNCGNKFFMPTGFTPNNDGTNDLLRPIILGDVVQYRFWVYNRWGELVFETSDMAQAWNGIYKGREQTSGVFVWMCNYQFAGEVLRQEKGTAVLIR